MQNHMYQQVLTVVIQQQVDLLNINLMRLVVISIGLVMLKIQNKLRLEALL
jgi:hypothetical protein